MGAGRPRVPIESKNSKKRTEDMEAVIFTLISTRKERFVPESAEFQLFDLGALRHSYNAEDNSPSRPFDQKKSLVAHAS